GLNLLLLRRRKGSLALRKNLSQQKVKDTSIKSEIYGTRFRASHSSRWEVFFEGRTGFERYISFFPVSGIWKQLQPVSLLGVCVCAPSRTIRDDLVIAKLGISACRDVNMFLDTFSH